MGDRAVGSLSSMPQNLLVRAALLLAPLFLLPVLLFAVSSGEERYRYPAPPKETRQLVIASPQWEGIRFEVEEAFRRWLYEHDGVGVDVTWLEQGGGSKTLIWIEQQYAAAKDKDAGIAADVLFGGGTDPYESLKGKGLLESYDPPPELLDPQRMPPDIAGFPLYDKDHTWFGTCLTGFGILVNRKAMTTLGDRVDGLEVADWSDLADPRLFGFVGAADPRSSSSYHTFFEIILQQAGSVTAGLRLLREIGGNVYGYTKFSAEIPKLCAVGQCIVAPTIDQYALAQIEKVAEFEEPGAPAALEFILPSGHALVNADAVGILRGSRHRATARRFIDFLLSDDAAHLWMLKRGESVGEFRGPTRFGLNRATVLPRVFTQLDALARAGTPKTLVLQNPFSLRFDFHYDYALANRRWSVVNDLLGAFLIDTRKELAEAIAVWRRLEGDTKLEAEKILFSLPFTEEEMSNRILADWKDTTKRERMKSEWTAFARARYESVAFHGTASASLEAKGRSR